MPKVKRFDTMSANSSTTRIFLKDSRVQKRHQDARFSSHHYEF
jgi:hypothetical protein